MRFVNKGQQTTRSGVASRSKVPSRSLVAGGGSPPITPPGGRLTRGTMMKLKVPDTLVEDMLVTVIDPLLPRCVGPANHWSPELTHIASDTPSNGTTLTS